MLGCSCGCHQYLQATGHYAYFPPPVQRLQTDERISPLHVKQIFICLFVFWADGSWQTNLQKITFQDPSICALCFFSFVCFFEKTSRESNQPHLVVYRLVWCTLVSTLLIWIWYCFKTLLYCYSPMVLLAKIQAARVAFHDLSNTWPGSS